MANPRHNTQTTNRRGAMGGGMMKRRPGYNKGKLVGGQVKIASAAAPKDKITGEDFRALKKSKASGGRAGYKAGRRVGGGKSMGNLPTPIRLSLVEQAKQKMKK